jgi:CRISPR type III-B/RAMP module-associated protein Cmr5
MISIEKERAALAWKAVKALPANVLSEYRALARNFPSMVQSMGLAQTLAFLMSRASDKKNEQHIKLRDHLTDWLFHDNSTVPWKTKIDSRWPTGSKLLERLLAEDDPLVWWHADQEAIEYGIWLKRFAEALAEK